MVKKRGIALVMASLNFMAITHTEQSSKWQSTQLKPVKISLIFSLKNGGFPLGLTRGIDAFPFLFKV